MKKLPNVPQLNVVKLRLTPGMLVCGPFLFLSEHITSRETRRVNLLCVEVKVKINGWKIIKLDYVSIGKVFQSNYNHPILQLNEEPDEEVNAMPFFIFKQRMDVHSLERLRGNIWHGNV